MALLSLNIGTGYLFLVPPTKTILGLLGKEIDSVLVSFVCFLFVFVCLFVFASIMLNNKHSKLQWLIAISIYFFLLMGLSVDKDGFTSDDRLAGVASQILSVPHLLTSSLDHTPSMLFSQRKSQEHKRVSGYFVSAPIPQ